MGAWKREEGLLLQAGFDWGQALGMGAGVGVADFLFVGHKYRHKRQGAGRVVCFKQQPQIPGMSPSPRRSPISRAMARACS